MSIRYLRSLTAVPSLSGNDGKYLTNDGISTLWDQITTTDLVGTSLPSTIVSSSLTSLGTLSSLSLGGNITATTSITLKGADYTSANITLTGGSGSTAYSGFRGGNVSITGGTGNLTPAGQGGGHVTIAGGDNIGGSVGTLGGHAYISGGTSPGGGGAVILSTAATSSLTERFRITNNGAWSVGSDGSSYGTSGQVLTSNGNAAPSWQSISVFPSQTGNSGKYLTTDGTSTSWATVSSASSLPSQTGNSGKYLTTDGTNASWATVSSALSGTVAFTAGYNEPISAVTASASTTIDCSLGNNFDISLSASITSLSFTNVPANRRLYPCTLILIQDAVGGRTVSWPAGFKWSGKSTPTLTSTAGGIDIITMITYDGGATWLATVAGQNF